MRNHDDDRDDGRAPEREVLRGLPQPTTSFRRRAWLQFQRALDPLAPPKRFRIGRR
jgi:hypothetical protein